MCFLYKHNVDVDRNDDEVGAICSLQLINSTKNIYNNNRRKRKQDETRGQNYINAQRACRFI
jgi:hypothetical protein